MKTLNFRLEAPNGQLVRRRKSTRATTVVLLGAVIWVLSGSGAKDVPELLVSQSPVDFGDQQVGLPSSMRRVTLTNVGSAPAEITTVAVGGAGGIFEKHEDT